MCKYLLHWLVCTHSGSKDTPVADRGQYVNYVSLFEEKKGNVIAALLFCPCLAGRTLSFDLGEGHPDGKARQDKFPFL